VAAGKGALAKTIYTFCGRIAIAVNPYERLPQLYSPQQVRALLWVLLWVLLFVLLLVLLVLLVVLLVLGLLFVLLLLFPPSLPRTPAP